MQYIIRDGKVIGTITQGNANLSDLASRGETIIEQDEYVELPALYENGKIVPQKPSVESLAILAHEREIQLELRALAEERISARKNNDMSD